MYKVYHSKKFDEELNKFDEEFKNFVDNIENQFVKNPYVGKPLGFKFFREKKYKKYRVYFLVYDDLKSVFMVGISNKKDQQKVINTIKFLLEFFRRELENLIKK